VLEGEGARLAVQHHWTIVFLLFVWLFIAAMEQRQENGQYYKAVNGAEHDDEDDGLEK